VTQTTKTCMSGNNLTTDGSGLCQREAVKRVRISGTSPARGVYDMCKECAAHWELVSPRTVTIVGGPVNQSDYTPGDPPVPVGSIVRYADMGRCRIVGHDNPERHPDRHQLPDDLSPYYPDGVAYALWKEGVPLKLDAHGGTLWVRRTSFRVIEAPEGE
jgi:hypothetical protein